MKEKVFTQDHLQAFNNKDPEAFRNLYYCQLEFMTRLIKKRYALPLWEIEDLVQDIFCSIWDQVQKGKQFDSVAHLQGYLCKVAINEGIDYLKKHKKLKAFLQTIKYNSDEWFTAIVVDTWDLDAQLKVRTLIMNELLLEHAIEALPAGYMKEVMRLFCLEQKTLGQIAIQLNITIKNVYKQKSKGLRRIAEMIKSAPHLYQAGQILLAILLLCWEKIKNILLP